MDHLLVAPPPPPVYCTWTRTSIISLRWTCRRCISCHLLNAPVDDPPPPEPPEAPTPDVGLGAVPPPPPPADVIVENIEFDPLTSPPNGSIPAPPPPTVIGYACTETGKAALDPKGDSCIRT
jgi:hypothetical protein